MPGNQTGFTIIELLIATAIFSVILLVTGATLIGISGTYVKGTVEGQTQQTARSILTDISQDIEFNKPNVTVSQSIPGTTDKFYFCIGNDIYVYRLDKNLLTGTVPTGQPGSEYFSWILVRYPSNTCSAPSGNPTTKPGAQELLVPNERLGQLDVASVSGVANGYTVSVEIAYGINTLLNDTDPDINGVASPPADHRFAYGCQSGPNSSFCGLSILTTTITSRVQ